jgi:hypothetical protein
MTVDTPDPVAVGEGGGRGLPADIAVAIDALEDWHDDGFGGRGGGKHSAVRDELDAIILSRLSAAEAARDAACARAERAEKALEHAGMAIVPRLFDIEAEERAWQFWQSGGRSHGNFIQCINAYVHDAAALASPAPVEEKTP